MPGGPGSGRRRLKKTSASGTPRLESAYKSVEDALAWLWLALASDEIDPRRGDSMTAVAKAMLASLRQNDERSVQDRIEKLRAKFDEIKRAGIARVEAERLHQEADLDSPPDTEPN